MSVDTLSRKFKESPYRKKMNDELSVAYDKSRGHRNSITFRDYSLPKWELFRACMSREFLLMKRNSFIYIFKNVQVSDQSFLFIMVVQATKYCILIQIIQSKNRSHIFLIEISHNLLQFMLLLCSLSSLHS